MTKDEYVLRSLSKLSRKMWELFVVSRIIHGICDPEIEFVCQQLVRRRNGKRALVDLYFPQFGVFLEVDEPQHASSKHTDSDRRRTEDIVSAANLEEHRIRVYDGDKTNTKSLASVAEETDRFIEYIWKLKEEAVSRGQFRTWNFEARFSSGPHIDRGFISLSTNAVFKYQKDALRCFGYTKDHYQRGAWTLSSDPSRAVWFPRLYETKDWDNDLSPDGQIITEKYKGGDTTELNVPSIKEWSSRIVFARYSDPLGSVMYRFVGEFAFEPHRSDEKVRVFKRISDRVETIYQTGN